MRELWLRLGVVERSRALSLPDLTVVAASTAAAAWFLHLSAARWANYKTGAFDLGFFDQIIFNTAHGRWFQTSFVPYSFLGQHLQPVLLLYVVPYRLGAGPPFLTATMDVAVAAAAFVLYLASRRWGLQPWVAASLSASYLLSPYLHRQINFDFHPEVMMALPLFAAVWAIAARRGVLAAALACSLLLFKEDAAFATIGLAALMWMSGIRRPATAAALIGLAWAVLGVFVLMPLFRHGQPSDLVDRYGYLVDTQRQSGVLPALALHPWIPAWHLLEPAHIRLAGLFLLATCPLAILRPWTLLLLIPGLGLALLSSHPEQAALQLQYSAEILPLACLGVLLGAARLQRWGTSTRLISAAVLLPALIGAATFSPIVPWNSDGTPPTSQHQQALEAGLALIPGGNSVVVSAQSELVPRLSQRRGIYEFPSHADAPWIVVDQYGLRSGQSLAAGFFEALAHVRMTDDRVYARDGVEVFRKR